MAFLLIQQRPEFQIPEDYRNWRLDPNGGGAGSLGIVKKFVGPDGFTAHAIKKYTNPYESDDRLELIQREITHLRAINHSNIVQLIGTYSVGKDLYHITIHCGTPLNKIIEEGRYSIDDAKKWIKDLLRAIEHLHAKDIIHRNLHPGNMCVDGNGKLTLLGLGKSRTKPQNRNLAITRERGTDPYMPLECLVDWVGQYDEKVDIWSVAVLLCELISGQPLFSGPQVKNKLKLLIEYCGIIQDNVLEKMESPTDRKALGEFSRKCERKDFIPLILKSLKTGRSISETDVLTNEGPLRHFLENTLQFDPDYRMSATECLVNL